MKSKQVDRLGQGLCVLFCLGAAGIVYENSKTTELDATVTRTGLVVAHDILSARAIETDKGTFSIGRQSADFKEGQRYHLTLYKTFTDPFMLGVPGTILKADPAP